MGILASLKTGNNGKLNLTSSNNASKLEEIKKTKGIIEKESELTLEKFARIESLEKKLDNISAMQMKLADSLGLISGDTKNIVDGMLAIAKTYQENNSILFDLAANSKSIRSQLDSIACRITSPKPENIKEEKEKIILKKKEEKEEIKPNESQIEKAFRIFKSFFPGSFAGSETNKLSAFQGFIDLIMEESEEGIKNAMSKYCKLHEGKLIVAKVSNKNFISAMLKTLKAFDNEEEEKPKEEKEKEKPKIDSKKLPPLGKEKDKQKEEATALEDARKIMEYYLLHLGNNDFENFSEIVKTIRLDKNLNTNHLITVNTIYDWIKEYFPVKINTVKDFITYYKDNAKTVDRLIVAMQS